MCCLCGVLYREIKEGKIGFDFTFFIAHIQCVRVENFARAETATHGKFFTLAVGNIALFIALVTGSAVGKRARLCCPPSLLPITAKMRSGTHHRSITLSLKIIIRLIT